MTAGSSSLSHGDSLYHFLYNLVSADLSLLSSSSLSLSLSLSLTFTVFFSLHHHHHHHHLSIVLYPPLRLLHLPPSLSPTLPNEPTLSPLIPDILHPVIPVFLLD